MIFYVQYRLRRGLNKKLFCAGSNNCECISHFPLGRSQRLSWDESEKRQIKVGLVLSLYIFVWERVIIYPVRAHKTLKINTFSISNFFNYVT